MIEFGAGGTIVQASEGTAAGTNPPGEGEAAESPEENAAGAGAADTTATDGGPTATGTGTSAISPIAPVMPPATTRRKRKAKGWFCPVCRQRKSRLFSLHLFLFSFEMNVFAQRIHPASESLRLLRQRIWSKTSTLKLISPITPSPLRLHLRH